MTVNSTIELRAEVIKKLHSQDIPNHSMELRTEIVRILGNNPFIADADFEQILKNRCSEVVSALNKQISVAKPLELGDRADLMGQVESSTEEMKEQLRESLRVTREEAEEVANNLQQSILSVATNKHNITVDSLNKPCIPPDVEDEVKRIRSAVVDSCFESEWPYGACSRQEEMRNQLIKEVEDEAEEERHKIVAAAINSKLSSFAQEIADELETGKFIPLQELEPQLSGGLSGSKNSFHPQLKNMGLPSSKYGEELRRKLVEQKNSFTQINQENWAKFVEETC